MRKVNSAGFSLIEMLVVILVFATLAVLSTGSLLLSLRGSKRSESSIGVRENLNYALSIIERQLHNAESIEVCSATSITYRDANSQLADFTCNLAPLGAGTVASSSAQLTSNEISVTACNFTCSLSSPGVPPSVTITISGQDADSAGLEQQQVTMTTKIMLRTY